MYIFIQAWYQTWACLQSWPLYHGRSGLVVAACPGSCSLVQTSCPFITIHEDASMAAGDPTFLCQGDMFRFINILTFGIRLSICNNFTKFWFP